ncbi:Hypothetical protein NTJ_13816 [Nesidiocoris tenuis]|uniref:Uncharacterized protein n=1 Tax=Nesidiocoris tenuis TaxID=355587 RepID=A0ABN7BB06_9HEMI|nr:Hypothetical protein NTJ_13816 [Nesidiocoris tenuis]
MQVRQNGGSFRLPKCGDNRATLASQVAFRPDNYITPTFLFRSAGKPFSQRKVSLTLDREIETNLKSNDHNQHRF